MKRLQGVPFGFQLRKKPHRFIWDFAWRWKRKCGLELFRTARSRTEDEKEFPDIEMISCHEAKRAEGYTSVLFQTKQDLSGLEGSIQWICKSPYGPNHKRKNWFVDVSVIPEAEVICKEQEIRFERFHCGGKGGQNVNKVEAGVRLIHIPTGITVTSTAERSQYANKKDALNKLNGLLKQMELEENKKQVNSAWQEHTKIIRGNPVRVYMGMEFRRKIR